jgi:NitT/TauT family transport system substrate-binding protein
VHVSTQLSSCIGLLLTIILYIGVFSFDKIHKIHRHIDKVILYLQWYDQAQFAGFYVAKEKGFYNDANIEIEIKAKPKDVGKEWDVPAIVSSASTERESNGEFPPSAFGIWTGDQVLKEETENRLNISAVGAVFNRSLVSFMVLEKSEIFGPKEFAGRLVGSYPGYDSENILNWLMAKYSPGMPPKKVVIKPNDDPLALLKSGDIEVLPTYVINEPLKAEADGLEFRLIEPTYYNLRYYSDTVIVNATTLLNNRALVAHFLEASEKGWKYALDHQDEAVGIIMSRKRDSSKEEKEQEARMLSTIAVYVNPSPMFAMNPKTWSSMAQVLAKSDPQMRSVRDCGSLCDFDIAWIGHDTTFRPR